MKIHEIEKNKFYSKRCVDGSVEKVYVTEVFGWGVVYYNKILKSGKLGKGEHGISCEDIIGLFPKEKRTIKIRELV